MNKYRILVLLFSFGIFCQVYAKKSVVDQKTQLGLLLNKIYTIHSKGDDPEIGLKFCEKALLVAVEINDGSAIASIKYNQCKFYRMKNQMDKAIKVILSIDPKFDNFYTNNQLGEIFLEIGDYRQAIPYLKNMIKSSTSNEGNFYNYNFLGRAYIALGDYENAKATFISQKILSQKLNKDELIFGSINNLIFFNNEFHRLEESEKYVNEFLSYSTGFISGVNDTLAIFSSLYDNIGRLFFLKNDFKNAIYYLQKSLAYNKNEISYNLESSSLFKLHQSYLNNNQYNKAIELSKQFRNAKLSPESALILNKMIINENIYKHQFTSIENLLKENEKYFKLIQIKKDSIATQKMDVLGKIYVESAKNALQVESLEKKQLAEKQKTSLITFSFIILIIMLMGGSVFIIQHQKRKQAETKNKLLEIEQKNSTIDVELKKKDIQYFALDISHRIHERNLFLEDLQLISKGGDENIKVNLRKLISKIQSLAQSRAGVEKLIQNTDFVDFAFTKKLNQQHPELTKYEQEFCTFIKLGMSNKDIANLKNIELGSARTSRARIKKKLNIGEQELLPYLNSI
ncbi:MAG: tetratricopeptide repeat protein [Flavobacteriales bacterium]|nr:tetratricopeptide repeat protein [Flavobacteriales bacterium]